MSGEWKPGNVARTKRGGTVARTATRRWVLLDDGRQVNLDHEPRPLIVIDPEDLEQVERLERDLADRMGWHVTTINNARLFALQAALRSLVEPPKPEDVLAEVFKAAWHAADARGETGSRTKAGIAAVLAKLEQADLR